MLKYITKVVLFFTFHPGLFLETLFRYILCMLRILQVYWMSLKIPTNYTRLRN